MLRGRQALFVGKYIELRDPEAAAVAAGYAPSGVHATAFNLLKKPEIAEAIERSNRAIEEKAQVSAADVVRMWSEAATLDRNELMEIRRSCCRYCWGQNNEYQETPAERRLREKAHQAMLAATPQKEWHKIPPFDEMGGLGYNARKDPNAECPECFGEGEMRVIIKDTRKLSRAAKQLYEGFKVTKDGVEVKIMPREKAIDNLAKYLGVVKPDAPPPGVNVLTSGDVTLLVPSEPVEASRIYQKLLPG